MDGNKPSWLYSEYTKVLKPMSFSRDDEALRGLIVSENHGYDFPHEIVKSGTIYETEDIIGIIFEDIDVTTTNNGVGASGSLMVSGHFINDEAYIPVIATPSQIKKMRKNGLYAEGEIMPNITIDENGEWCVNGESTGVSAKGENGKSIYRFVESSVSSTFSGTTELSKEDMEVKGVDATVGDLAIFPDNKSLVLFVGTIQEVEGDTYTVGNITYFSDSPKASGEWVQGTKANYPELYSYNGSSYMCLGRDIDTAPNEEETTKWQLIARGIRPIYTRFDGDPISDTGAENDYVMAIANLTPSDIKPIVGDRVIFQTNEQTYIGTVKQFQDTAVVVEVRMAIPLIIE